jgi:hypothetical protein
MRLPGIGALLIAGAAIAQPEVRGQVPDRRGISLLLGAGSYTGFGGGVGIGTRDIGVQASAGWLPLLFSLNSDLKFYSGFQVGPDLYARIFSPQPTADIGALAGYRYSTLLGHGFTVGGYAQFVLTRAVDGNVSVGLLIFPDGEDHLAREENLPPGVQYSFPGPKVNFGVSAGLAFFP